MLRAMCILVFCFSATAVQAEDYKLTLRGLAGTAAACTAKIEQAANAFEESTAAVVVEATCKQLIDNVVNGEITYIADEPVKRSNTHSGLALASHGRFVSKQECLVELESESLRFSELTGLDVWFKYCSNETYVSGASWALNIEALGEAEVQYFVGSTPIYGRIMGDGTQFKQTIKDRLQQLDVDVVDVVIHNKLASADLVVHYYSDTRVRIESQERLKFPSTQACLSANEWVKSVFDETNQLISYCSTVMGRVELGQIFYGPIPLGAGASIKKFNSYNACLAEENEQNQIYSDKLGERYLGGKCAYAPEARGSLFAFNFFYR